MGARSLRRATLAAAFAAAGLQPAVAGGPGGAGHGGPIFRPATRFHAFGGFGLGGGGRVRGLPPISGIIHERGGPRPYASAYGHADTGLRFGGLGRGGGPLYGHTGTALRAGSFGGRYGERGGEGLYGHTATALPAGGYPRPYAGRYGHLGTSLRYGGADRGPYRRFGAFGEGRRRLAGGRFAGGFGGGFGDGYGAGLYGAPGIYGDAGVYGGQGAYGQAGTYGGAGTYATQSAYGNGGGASYASERPLAARFAEPPLAPSPYAPYSPGDRYAYAASEDVGSGPRVLRVHPGSGCGCEAGDGPTFYRYGVGTAY